MYPIETTGYFQLDANIDIKLAANQVIGNLVFKYPYHDKFGKKQCGYMDVAWYGQPMLSNSPGLLKGVFVKATILDAHANTPEENNGRKVGVSVRGFVKELTIIALADMPAKALQAFQDVLEKRSTPVEDVPVPVPAIDIPPTPPEVARGHKGAISAKAPPPDAPQRPPNPKPQASPQHSHHKQHHQRPPSASRHAGTTSGPTQVSSKPNPRPTPAAVPVERKPVMAATIPEPALISVPQPPLPETEHLEQAHPKPVPKVDQHTVPHTKPVLHAVVKPVIISEINEIDQQLGQVRGAQFKRGKHRQP